MSRSTSAAVSSLMPHLKADLARLVEIPSVSAPGYPEETRPALLQAHELILGLLRDAGVEELDSHRLPETAPFITGEIPGPAGAPTVLLYGHYDVVPAGDESKWESPPFEPTERDGAMFGRGAADSKSNVIAHVGALRAWEGRPPVGIKLVIEGQEEVGSALNTYPPAHPELFRADAMLIADMGSVRPGLPTLTVALRGTAMPTIEVETLVGPKHSGQRHLEAVRPFGIELRVQPGAIGNGFSADTSGPAYEAARAAMEAALGHGGLLRGDGGLDPARERVAHGGARGRDLVARGDGRVRQHPRSQRARPAGRVREGGRRRGRVLRALRGVLRDPWGEIVTSAPEAMPAKPPIMQRILGAIERGGNKMPNPAHPVRLAVRDLPGLLRRLSSAPTRSR